MRRIVKQRRYSGHKTEATRSNHARLNVSRSNKKLDRLQSAKTKNTKTANSGTGREEGEVREASYM